MHSKGTKLQRKSLKKILANPSEKKWHFQATILCSKDFFSCLVGAILARVGIRTNEAGFLTVIGEVFKQLLSKQQTSFIDPMLNNNLTAYRKDQNCETSFIGLVERWKQAVDKRNVVGVLSTDMSKAFDSLYPPLEFGSVKNNKRWMRDHERLGPGDRRPGPFSGTSFKTTYTSPPDENRLFMYADDHQLFSVAKATNEAESILTEKGNNISEWYSNNLLHGNFSKYQVWARGIVTRIYTS